jgi:Ca2+-binding EF-hand superfamily protein
MTESVTVAMKTFFKMADVPLDGKISREDFVKYAEHERDHLKLLNPGEAEKVYSNILALTDMLGLDKFAKDGGISYTLRELDIVRRVLARKDLPEVSHTLNTAYFRAIDTNGDHFLEKDEWSQYLKICNTYTSEEQAMQSFDSIDKNKDGVISLEEYVEYAIDFWCNLGEEHGALNLYGTKDL